MDGQAHTNGVESFWSMLKRGYHGTYHHVCVAPTSTHNVRSLGTLDQMAEVARGMVGKRLRYKDLVAG